MTLTQYLDLAYAVVVDEHVRRGDTLFDALEHTKEYASRRAGVSAFATAGGSQQEQRRKPEPESGVGGPGEPATATDLANAEAMRVLTGAMGGVQGGFK